MAEPPRLAAEAAALYDLLTRRAEKSNDTDEPSGSHDTGEPGESGPGDETGSDGAATASCTGCPICAGKQALHGLSPQAASALATAGVDALAALRDLMSAGQRALIAIAEDRVAARNHERRTAEPEAEPEPEL